MIEGPLVFVDVDTQRDFLEPGGALYIAGSEAIVPNLRRLTEFARERGIPILATACAHTLDEEDPEPFPPHCLVGTRGQERIEATACAWSHVVAPDGRFDLVETPSHLTVQKRYYDMFTHPDIDRIMERFNLDETTFVVYGVATDYCVRAAVLGLLERGRKVAVVVDAIRPVDPSREAEIFEEFVRQGALLTVADAVVDA